MQLQMAQSPRKKLPRKVFSYVMSLYVKKEPTLWVHSFEKSLLGREISFSVVKKWIRYPWKIEAE